MEVANSTITTSDSRQFPQKFYPDLGHVIQITEPIEIEQIV